MDDLQFKRVMSFIDKGKSEGATLATGGHRVGDKSFFVAPTIFSDVRDDMTIAKEEIFGPVRSRSIIVKGRGVRWVGDAERGWQSITLRNGRPCSP